MLRPTLAIVDLDVYAANIRALRRRMSTATAVCAMVKADAYGHGLIPCSMAAMAAGAKYLGVATADEGVSARQAGILAPIIVVGGIFREAASAVVEYDLTQTVFSADAIRFLEAHAARQGKRVRVHIKVDTGMNRIGIKTLREAEEIITALKSAPHIMPEGIFTHFARADAPERDLIGEQLAKFAELTAPFAREGMCPLRHAANSLGSLRAPQARMDIARVGIASYGYAGEPALRPCLSWKTRAVWVKEVAEGEGVSYGHDFVASRKTLVATLPVGYGDGYRRAIAGKGHVLIRGRRAPVIGRVCMDQTMVDVTDVPGAAVGDDVVLLGEQDDQRVTAEDIARWCGSISYEVLCGITARVPRVYVP